MGDRHHPWTMSTDGACHLFFCLQVKDVVYNHQLGIFITIKRLIMVTAEVQMKVIPS